ncbi:MAG: glycine oxidase ThiO [Chloroflexi bacterium]|nr:glycine oxidase ThiO [Chloroflexota bacterium]
MSSSTAEVAIIGGGVIGCSIAYHLAKRGIKSSVFEQNRFASGASGATAGMITPLWHVDHNNPALFALGMNSLKSFPDLAAELTEAGIDPELRMCGVLKVAMDDEQAEALKRDLMWQAELGLDVRWANTQDVLELEPEVNGENHGGVFSPQEGHIRGQRLVDSLVHAAGEMGATFSEGVEVISLITEGSRVLGVRTNRGELLSGHTVLAAGPWTGLVQRWIQQPSLPVRPVKGQRLLVRKPGFLPKILIHSFMGTNVPQSDGSILVGATRHEGEFDQEITVDAVSTILSNATTILPVLRDSILVQATAGVRPGSPDDVPIIGPVPGWEGLSVASGHDAVGVMLSPETGRLMADYIATGDATALEPFSLARFES